MSYTGRTNSSRDISVTPRSNRGSYNAAGTPSRRPSSVSAFRPSAISNSVAAYTAAAMSHQCTHITPMPPFMSDPLPPFVDPTATSIINKYGYLKHGYAQMPNEYGCPCCLGNYDESRKKNIMSMMPVDVIKERARSSFMRCGSGIPTTPPSYLRRNEYIRNSSGYTRNGSGYTRNGSGYTRNGSGYSRNGSGNSAASRNSRHARDANLYEETRPSQLMSQMERNNMPPPPKDVSALRGYSARSKRRATNAQVMLTLTIHKGSMLPITPGEVASVLVRCGTYEGQTSFVKRKQGKVVSWEERFLLPLDPHSTDPVEVHLIEGHHLCEKEISSAGKGGFVIDNEALHSSLRGVRERIKLLDNTAQVKLALAIATGESVDHLHPSSSRSHSSLRGLTPKGDVSLYQPTSTGKGYVEVSWSVLDESEVEEEEKCTQRSKSSEKRLLDVKNDDRSREIIGVSTGKSEEQTNQQLSNTIPDNSTMLRIIASQCTLVNAASNLGESDKGEVYLTLYHNDGTCSEAATLFRNKDSLPTDVNVTKYLPAIGDDGESTGQVCGDVKGDTVSLLVCKVGRKGMHDLVGESSTSGDGETGNDDDDNSLALEMIGSVLLDVNKLRDLASGEVTVTLSSSTSSAAKQTQQNLLYTNNRGLNSPRTPLLPITKSNLNSSNRTAVNSNTDKSLRTDHDDELVVGEVTFSWEAKTVNQDERDAAAHRAKKDMKDYIEEAGQVSKLDEKALINQHDDLIDNMQVGELNEGTGRPADMGELVLTLTVIRGVSLVRRDGRPLNRPSVSVAVGEMEAMTHPISDDKYDYNNFSSSSSSHSSDVDNHSNHTKEENRKIRRQLRLRKRRSQMPIDIVWNQEIQFYDLLKKLPVEGDDGSYQVQLPENIEVFVHDVDEETGEAKCVSYGEVRLREDVTGSSVVNVYSTEEAPDGNGGDNDFVPVGQVIIKYCWKSSTDEGNLKQDNIQNARGGQTIEKIVSEEVEQYATPRGINDELRDELSPTPQNNVCQFSRIENKQTLLPLCTTSPTQISQRVDVTTNLEDNVKIQVSYSGQVARQSSEGTTNEDNVNMQKTHSEETVRHYSEGNTNADNVNIQVSYSGQVARQSSEGTTNEDNVNMQKTRSEENARNVTSIPKPTPYGDTVETPCAISEIKPAGSRGSSPSSQCISPEVASTKKSVNHHGIVLQFGKRNINKGEEGISDVNSGDSAASKKPAKKRKVVRSIGGKIVPRQPWYPPGNPNAVIEFHLPLHLRPSVTRQQEEIMTLERQLTELSRLESSYKRDASGMGNILSRSASRF